jgi:hypothetical protein
MTRLTSSKVVRNFVNYSLVYFRLQQRLSARGSFTRNRLSNREHSVARNNYAHFLQGWPFLIIGLASHYVPTHAADDACLGSAHYLGLQQGQTVKAKAENACLSGMGRGRKEGPLSDNSKCAVDLGVVLPDMT